MPTSATFLVDLTSHSLHPSAQENGVADSALARLLADQHGAEGRGYCWFGGEASQARATRKFFRSEIGWDADQLDVMGYWQRDSESVE